MEWKLLADVPPEDVRRVLATARRRTFGRGEIVFHQGDPADSVHFIVKGRFAARVVTRLGDTTTLGVYARGDAVGEMALLSEHAVRSATVQALEPGETRALCHRDFALLRAEHPSVNDVLIRLLAEQVRRSSDRLVEALHVDADTRVRRRVVELCDQYGGDMIPLTQEDLAGLAGTSRATVNRVLREEERRGTVELRRGKTLVRDRAALEERAGNGTGSAIPSAW